VTAVRTKLKFLPGIAGAIGETGEQGPTGPTTIGTGGLAIGTKAAMASATIEASLTFAYTAGYTTAGDGGGGLYKRLATAPSSPSHPRYVRSVDRYTLAGATDATNGGYWELVPENGVVNIQQLGGVADFNGTTGTDNFAALTAALSWFAWEAAPPSLDGRYTYIINFPAGRYYFSAGYDLHVVAHIRGAGSQKIWDFNTAFFFPAATKHPFIFGGNNTSGWSTTGSSMGSADGTIFEGFSINYVGAVSLDRDAAAILARTTPNLRDIGVKGAPGHGFRIRGTSGGGGSIEGGPNQWNMHNCMVYSCLGDSLRVEGADANAGTCVNFQNQASVSGCGIYDDSTLGNTYVGGHISGYNNSGVSHGGNRYVLISPTDGEGASTTPGTNNDIWYNIGTGGADGQFPAWSSSNTYYIGLQIYCHGNGSLFNGTYIEGGTAGRTLIKAPAMGINVLGTHINKSNVFRGTGVDASGFYGHGGVGSYYSFESGQNGYSENGAYTWAGIGRPGTGTTDDGLAGTDAGLSVLVHGRGLDGGIYHYGYRGLDLIYRRPGGARFIYGVTTASSTWEFGRGAAIGTDMFMLYDPVLVDTTSEANGRVIGYRSSIPASGGPFAKGEIRFNSNPSPGGAVGWVCTTAGSPGTWKEFGTIAA
jgi:hypothetical protein